MDGCAIAERTTCRGEICLMLFFTPCDVSAPAHSSYAVSCESRAIYDLSSHANLNPRPVPTSPLLDTSQNYQHLFANKAIDFTINTFYMSDHSMSAHLFACIYFQKVP